ncbi:MAG: hypothetical protein VXB01_08525, partial [Opitutae bacterium]
MKLIWILSACLFAIGIFIYQIEPARNFFIEPIENFFQGNNLKQSKKKERDVDELESERRLTQDLKTLNSKLAIEIQQLKQRYVELEKDYIILVKSKNWKTQEILDAHKNAREGLLIENQRLRDRIGILE